ncbi:MAG: phospho-sugar mutase, partial [Lachnospiraceae bacterium]|nr:phospho-sugar mutase [Lachnospiraceae bacterium]
AAPTEVAGLPVVAVVDFATAAPMPVFGGRGDSAPQTLPSANVLELQLEGGHKLIIRPSGTEPKVKAYSFVKGSDPDQATALLTSIEAAARQLLA